MKREQMNIVIVGHVDHGKSTVIGRLLADTGSLPEGKLEQVKQTCQLNSRPFEYAFLLDALKDEQSQGITIDSARCFFKTGKRDYIIIDAPGHIEFLKNMVTGASRAEAALLVIDAHEGVQENSRRHGYMVSLLGIKQVVVLVNKMDLVDYSRSIFEKVKNEFSEFLDHINLSPISYIPVSAREGDNIVDLSQKMKWYNGNSTLEAVDNFPKEKPKEDKPFRFPVQDIYKFTNMDDDRRIIAGTVVTGHASVGDEVIFLPSGKISRIKSIEGFNEDTHIVINSGKATGFTLDTQVYIKPGEMMCRLSENRPEVAKTFKANIFWVGKSPMVSGKKYKLKVGSNRTTVYLKEVLNVIDSSSLNTEKNKRGIERHDVAECLLQTLKPVAFDKIDENEGTGRFVIVDNYEISGGGIIIEPATTGKSFLEEYVSERENLWVRSSIKPADRKVQYNQKSRLVVITGDETERMENLAKSLEEDLFKSGRIVYYMSILNLLSSLRFSGAGAKSDRDELIHRLGESAYLFTDAGTILIVTIPNLDQYEVEIIEKLNEPNEILVINLGDSYLDESVPLILPESEECEATVKKIKEILYEREVLIEYYL